MSANPIDAKPVAERVADYDRRQRDQGLKRVIVWVPESRVDELKEHAAELRRNDQLLLPREQREAEHRAWLERRSKEPQQPLPSMEPASSTKVGRNAPCPCGSGKKYKRCCGGTRAERRRT